MIDKALFLRLKTLPFTVKKAPIGMQTKTYALGFKKDSGLDPEAAMKVLRRSSGHLAFEEFKFADNIEGKNPHQIMDWAKAQTMYVKTLYIKDTGPEVHLISELQFVPSETTKIEEKTEEL